VSSISFENLRRLQRLSVCRVEAINTNYSKLKMPKGLRYCFYTLPMFVVFHLRNLVLAVRRYLDLSGSTKKRCETNL